MPENVTGRRLITTKSNPPQSVIAHVGRLVHNDPKNQKPITRGGKQVYSLTVLDGHSNILAPTRTMAGAEKVRRALELLQGRRKQFKRASS